MSDKKIDYQIHSQSIAGVTTYVRTALNQPSQNDVVSRTIFTTSHLSTRDSNRATQSIELRKNEVLLKRELICYILYCVMDYTITH